MKWLNKTFKGNGSVLEPFTALTTCDKLKTLTNNDNFNKLSNILGYYEKVDILVKDDIHDILKDAALLEALKKLSEKVSVNAQGNLVVNTNIIVNDKFIKADEIRTKTITKKYTSSGIIEVVDANIKFNKDTIFSNSAVFNKSATFKEVAMFNKQVSFDETATFGGPTTFNNSVIFPENKNVYESTDNNGNNKGYLWRQDQTLKIKT